MSVAAALAAIEHPFLFLRHCETAWNAMKRPQGGLETALNDVGLSQARALAAFFAAEQERAPVARIVASPLQRVRWTAEPVAAALNLSVVYADGLREVRLGAGEGADHGPWLKAFWAGKLTPEGAESFYAFAERAARAIAAAVDRENVLIVAHGGVWRGLLAHIEVEPKFWMTNAAPVRVVPRRGAPWRVEKLVDRAASDGSAV